MRQAGARDGRIAQQHALLLQRIGRLDDALEGYRQAIVLMRRSGHDEDVVALLCNRGVLQAYRGGLRAAEADLREAERLAREIDQPLHAAIAQGNLGWLSTRRGELPSALASFDAAAPVLHRSSGWRGAVMEVDRCHALLSAGPAARGAGKRAARRLDVRGQRDGGVAGGGAAGAGRGRARLR